ncbi:MAG: LysR substrate-binding domain-containing protein [Burkholderiales bacterium]
MQIQYSEAMTLKQLRCLREISRQSLNISAAAAVLHTSQPGISRQIQDLERELGVDLLVRRKNRILDLTETGRQVLGMAERMLGEAENIRHVARENQNESEGELTLATSHLHARYTLRGPIKRFTKRYPRVRLRLLQADVDDVPRLVETSEADVGISTDVVHEHPSLILLPSSPILRSVIMPRDHPLARRKKLTLADLARYPIVGYNPRSRGGQIIAKAFRERDIEARFVVSASDSDVIKTYVEEGLGIAVVPTLALAGSETKVHAVDATQLFPRSVMVVSLRRNIYLRRYLVDFIRMLVPDLDQAAIQRAADEPAARAGR